MKNLWAVEWLRWPGYGQFWGQLVREHMRQKKRQQYDMRAEIDAATGHVKASIDAIGGDDRFQNGLDAKLTVDRARSRTARREKMPMRQTAPGRYESDFPLERFGSFLLHASLEKGVDDGKGGQKSVQVAESFGHVTNPYPREYLALAPDLVTLSRTALVTGGRMDPGREGRLRSGGRDDPLPPGSLVALHRRGARRLPARSPDPSRAHLRSQEDGEADREAPGVARASRDASRPAWACRGRFFSRRSGNPGYKGRPFESGAQPR